MLGDTSETVGKHYTPFVHELRERVRMILETENVQNPGERSSERGEKNELAGPHRNCPVTDP